MPQERKLVTVLFADIVDSTDATRGLDPEVTRDLLARTFARARDVLTHHGGTVEKFIGDAIMAVFGVPAAHEDDAQRAIRAALELHAISAEGLPFTLRIGVNSGEVVAGDGTGGEFLVTGQPVVVAARLEQAAAPGEILVGPLTRELTRGAVRYGPARRVDAKGIGPVEAAAALETIDAAEAATPFVDRERELSLLRDVHDRVTRSGRPHLVTIYGDPGVGKTRLARELVAQLPPGPTGRAHCLPYGTSAYAPLLELLRVEATITPADSKDAARAKIAASARALFADPAEADRVGHELARGALAEGDAEAESRIPLVRAMRSYLEARLATETGTIVIEDLHWAAPAFLDLAEDLLANVRAPLLLVCLARPELRQRRPAWGAQANALSIVLEPLSPGDTERLARALLDRADDGRVAEIVARTEGNPLFVEEYVRMMGEHAGATGLPATLHGVIEARLDATPADVKRLVQEASVLGRDFWIEALPPVDAAARTHAVEDAERRDIILATARRGPGGARTYSFRHVLIRDVAYGSVPKGVRSELHDRYARWLRDAAGDRASEHLDAIAYHAERAFALAREVRSGAATELAQKAFAALAAAAGAARTRADFRSAHDLYQRALSAARAARLAGGEHVVAEGLAAITRVRLEASAEALGELDVAIEATRELGPSEHLVHLLIWRASAAIPDDPERAGRLYGEAVEAARACGDPDAIAYALWARSELASARGDQGAQLRSLEEARDHMRRTGSERWLAACLVDLSTNALARDDGAAARALAAEALAVANASGRRLDRFKATAALADALAAARDADAVATASAAQSLAAEIGGPWALARAARTLAAARESAGDGTGALAIVSGALAGLDAARMPTVRREIGELERLRDRLLLWSARR